MTVLDADYMTALSDLCEGYSALKPPKRVSVSQGASENLIIKQPGAAGGPWSAAETPYMVEPMDMLASRKHEAVVFVGPARTGKCLDVNTPIPTPAGWVTMGALKAGDFVFGADGKPTRVLAAHDVKVGLRCYKVEFSDGSHLVADAEHLWGVERFYWKSPSWRYEVRSTESLMRDLFYAPRGDGGKRFRYRVRNTRPLQLPDRPLLVDPYLLGVWLGNGSSQHGTISCHEDDAAHYVACFEAEGHTTSVRKDGENTVYVVVDRLADGPDDLIGTFTQRLRLLGVLGAKHIPESYLFASREQRLALVRGLMDTDGYCGEERSSCEFSTISAGLANSMAVLLRSLGLRPSVCEKESTWVYNGERKFGRAYRVVFSTPDGLDVFYLPRKKTRNLSAEIDIGFRQIVNIEPVETRPVRCIAVDNASKLFLAGDGLVPTHNTAGLLQGWLAHAVVNDPGDMLLLQMTKEKAREFSKTDVDRAIRNSPRIAEFKSPRAVDANTFDTMFKHGMWLRIAWPTVSNVSGSTYRYVAITDHDRIENAENVDGEGPLFDLARKRTTTFLSRGMCLAESSPGIELTDANWQPATPHEAPPVKGILGLYNRSDRRRWYWRCIDCHTHFEAAPGLGLFNLPSDEELIDRVRSENIIKIAEQYGSRVICPHCGSLIQAKHKVALNRSGIWVPEGMDVDSDGVLQGEPPRSTIAGYWLGGVAAAYQSWKSLIERHLQGLREYALTGSEETLKATINTDQGMPYISRHLVENRANGTSIESRASEGVVRHVAPEWTRTVLVAVDVQGGVQARFEVQVHAVGVHMEQQVIDRFVIKESMREGMGGEFAPLDPARYPEDWDTITEKVLRATWRTPVEGREIQARRVVVDSGGEDGVTANAYAWFRKMRREGYGDRVRLYKGATEPKAPIVKESMVGKIGAKGRADIPLLLCNPNLLSDAVDAGLKRATPGPGYIHLPKPKHPTGNPDGWVTQAFFDELKAEVRGKNGTWQKVRKRNETFDLCRMIRAGMLSLKLDKVKDWNAVPPWLAPLEMNSLIVTREERQEMKQNVRVEAPPEPEPTPAPVRVVAPLPRRRPRRSAPSPYLR